MVKFEPLWNQEFFMEFQKINTWAMAVGGEERIPPYPLSKNSFGVSKKFNSFLAVLTVYNLLTVFSSSTTKNCSAAEEKAPRKPPPKNLVTTYGRGSINVRKWPLLA